MSNKNQPPNDLAKCLYYYTRDFMSLLHFEIEIALSKSFSKLPLYTTFLLFLKWVRIIIFQINTDFLILQLFIQDTLHLSFISKKSLYSPSHKFLETSTFFITFWLVFTVEMVYNISNKYWLPSNILKHWYFYTKTLYHSIIWEKNWHSPSQTFFEISAFYHIFFIFNSE